MKAYYINKNKCVDLIAGARKMVLLDLGYLIFPSAIRETIILYGSIVAVTGVVTWGIAYAGELELRKHKEVMMVAQRRVEEVKIHEAEKRYQKMQNEISPQKIKNINMADYF